MRVEDSAIAQHASPAPARDVAGPLRVRHRVTSRFLIHELLPVRLERCQVHHVRDVTLLVNYCRLVFVIGPFAVDEESPFHIRTGALMYVTVSAGEVRA